MPLQDMHPDSLTAAVVDDHDIIHNRASRCAQADPPVRVVPSHQYGFCPAGRTH